MVAKWCGFSDKKVSTFWAGIQMTSEYQTIIQMIQQINLFKFWKPKRLVLYFGCQNKVCSTFLGKLSYQKSGDLYLWDIVLTCTVFRCHVLRTGGLWIADPSIFLAMKKDLNNRDFCLILSLSDSSQETRSEWRTSVWYLNRIRIMEPSE